jgi:pSer/pThr/pTyr-binding forkhead associated (FHA) protein
MDRRLRLIERGISSAETREIGVTTPEFLIGRGPDCDLRLRSSDVSRHHCIIHQRAGETAVLDLGSSNGTYLNGQRVRSQSSLSTGDELRVGTSTFVVDLGDRGSIDLGLSDVDPLAATQRGLKAPEGPPK